MSIFKLIRLFQKAKGRSPSPSELANLKKQAEVVVEKEKIIRPDFGGSLREFTRKEDLYEGNKKGLEKLLESGEVKIGQALKTKKKKPAVDPKFESAVKAQDERRRDIKDWETRLKTKLEQQNKSNAYKSALRQYRDIDKKPLSIDEVTIRYKNMAKYPEGRNIIIDDVYEIERGLMLPNIGNRTREKLVGDLKTMMRSPKKSNPFKKAPDEVKGQIEMDFTDWDPKGMKGGGLAHMLGYAEGGEVNPIRLRRRLMEVITAMHTAPQEEIPMLALEARKIRQQLAKFKKEEPSVMEEAQEAQQDPFQQDTSSIKSGWSPTDEKSSYHVYAPGTMTSRTGGEKIIDDQITIEDIAGIPNYRNMSRPVKASMNMARAVRGPMEKDLDKIMRGRVKSPTKGLEALKELIRGDITEGDPRGYEKGGRVPMMYGGDPGFAFEYGGSWADWRDNHQHMMPVTEYIGTKLPKERLPFRQELAGGGLAGLPPVQFGPVGITPRANVSHTSGSYGPTNTQKTWSDNIGFDATIDLPAGFKIKGKYDKHTKRDRLYNPGGEFLDKRVRDDHDRYNVGIEWSKKFGGPKFADGGPLSQDALIQMYIDEGMSYNEAVQAASASQGLPWDILSKAEGGRIGFDKGGFNKGRRNFMKMAAGLAALPFVGKFFKAAKPAAKAVKAVETSNAAGMPAWFPKLVDKILKEGKDVTNQYSTIERSVVKQVELPDSKTKVLVEHDLTTGDTIVDIGMGKHGWESGRYGQPTRLSLTKGQWIEPEISKTGKVKKKKGVKTKDEFDVEEAEFTGGHPENIKYEDVSIEKYGNHASDFSEVERYATGKNVDKYNLKGTKKAKADDFAQGRAEMEAEQIDEFASGGVAHMLGR